MSGWERFIKSPGTVIRNYYKVLAGDQQHMFCKKVTLDGWFKHKRKHSRVHMDTLP